MNERRRRRETLYRAPTVDGDPEPATATNMIRKLGVRLSGWAAQGPEPFE
jgi:hypothetical protein